MSLISEIQAKLTPDTFFQLLGISQKLVMHGTNKTENFECIFHGDNTPSARLEYRNKWRYKCFAGSCIASDGIDILECLNIKYGDCNITEVARQLGLKTSEKSKLYHEHPYLKGRGIVLNNNISTYLMRRGIMIHEDAGKNQVLITIKNEDGENIQEVFFTDRKEDRYRYPKGVERRIFPFSLKKKVRFILLTEGIFDVLSLLQPISETGNIEEYEVFAIGGKLTCMSELRQIIKNTKPEMIIFAFDNDKAGISYTLKYGETIKAEYPKIQLRVLDTDCWSFQDDCNNALMKENLDIIHSAYSQEKTENRLKHMEKEHIFFYLGKLYRNLDKAPLLNDMLAEHASKLRPAMNYFRKNKEVSEKLKTFFTTLIETEDIEKAFSDFDHDDAKKYCWDNRSAEIKDLAELFQKVFSYPIMMAFKEISFEKNFNLFHRLADTTIDIRNLSIQETITSEQVLKDLPQGKVLKFNLFGIPEIEIRNVFLILIGAQTSVGKTTFSVFLVYRLLKENPDIKIMVLLLEMAQEDVCSIFQQYETIKGVTFKKETPSTIIQSYKKAVGEFDVVVVDHLTLLNVKKTEAFNEENVFNTLMNEIVKTTTNTLVIGTIQQIIKKKAEDSSENRNYGDSTSEFASDISISLTRASKETKKFSKEQDILVTFRKVRKGKEGGEQYRITREGCLFKKESIKELNKPVLHNSNKFNAK